MGEYVAYFLAKVGKLSYESIEKKGVPIAKEIRKKVPEYNTVFLKRLELELETEIRETRSLKELIKEKALKAFPKKKNPIINLVLLGINIGCGCYFTRRPYTILLKTIEMMLEEDFSDEDLGFLQNYRESVVDYLKTWNTPEVSYAGRVFEGI